MRYHKSARGEPRQKCANEERSIDVGHIKEMEFADKGGGLLDELQDSPFNGWVVTAP